MTIRESANRAGAGTSPNGWWALGEIVLILLIFFLYAGGLPPDVNEAHYLCKAKHFWQPEWCRDDFFLNTADAHLVFYGTVGWLSQFVSLPATAWIGRWCTWTLLAAGWWSLCRQLWSVRGMALLSAALAITLWDRCHMAGEWIIGGVEAKSIAYGIVFFALGQLVRGRWMNVFLLLGAASAFHVLVGGWAVITAFIVWGLDRNWARTWRTLAVGLAGGAILSLPGLIPALRLSMDATPMERAMANEIYVFHRLSHHLLPMRMDPVYVLRFGVLSAAWFVMCWRLRPSNGHARVQKLVACALVLASVGTALSWWMAHHRTMTSSWMRYYWFRQSDAFVPLGVALLWTQAVGVQAVRAGRNRWYVLMLAVALVVPAAFLSYRVGVRCLDPRPGGVVQGSGIPVPGGQKAWTTYQDWRELCEWIRTETDRNAVFLSPTDHQTLKWYAERAEVVTWKDVPQDAAGLIAWWHRLQAVRASNIYSTWKPVQPEKLQQLLDAYDVDYVITEQLSDRAVPVFPVVYQNGSYRLLRVVRDPGRRN